jgi:septal ring factor EnvC (AmiA/AmiB activator)
VAADRNNTQWQRDLAHGHTSLATVYWQQSDIAQALAELREARAIMAALVALAPNLANWTEYLAWIDQQIARLEVK